MAKLLFTIRMLIILEQVIEVGFIYLHFIEQAIFVTEFIFFLFYQKSERQSSRPLATLLLLKELLMQLDLMAALPMVRKQVSADLNFNCSIIRIIFFEHFVIAVLVNF